MNGRRAVLHVHYNARVIFGNFVRGSLLVYGLVMLLFSSIVACSSLDVDFLCVAF